MAKVKFGAIITDSRGAIGGQQLQMTRYGNVLGQKATQRAKSSNLASTARSLFTNFSKRWWSALDATQRDDWRTLAAANPITNPWGDEYPLTGLAYYIKLNCRLVAAGLTPTDNAPTDQAVTALSTLTLSATAPDVLQITFTPSPVPTDYLLYCFATGALSPGVTQYASALHYIGTVAAAETSPFDLGALYTLRLPELRAGRQYGVSVAMLNTTNGALSPPILADTIAT